MKHLGERVTALVDDQLDHDARDLALAHLANCAACQTAVSAEREVATTLRDLPAAQPSGALVQRLIGVAEPGGPLPPERRTFPGAATPPARWRAAGTRPGTIPRQREPMRTAPVSRRAGVRYAVAGSVSMGVLAVVLASLGGDPDDAVTPPTQQFTVEHARSTGSLPFTDPAAVVVPAGLAQVPQP